VPRLGSLLVLLAIAGTLSAAAPATEPRSFAATVTGVVTPDTLDVRLASGKLQRIRIAGVRGPAAADCYGAEATGEARRLVLGKRVRLLADGPAAYVTLPGGADLGRALVSRGLAQIDAWGRPFARFASYVPVQQRAEGANAGLWGACAADVAVALAATPNPVAVGGRLTFTVTVSNRGPLAAPRVAVELRPPAGVTLVSAESAAGACTARDWVGACTWATLAPDATVTATFVGEVTRPGTISTRATVRLAGCVRAACGAAPLHDSDLRNDETAALVTALDSATPPPPPSSPPPPGSPPPATPPPPPTGACHPSYPGVCIPPPPPDLDCADIPFRDFAAPLNAPDPDPHDLDGDEDGVGCQFNDY
jgi:uncharacterized repeat protein (TIGR01451 family)